LRYFSAKAVEELLAKDLYIERDGKLYVSPRIMGTKEDYSKVIISSDATVSKDGAKTLSVEVPEVEWAESSEKNKNKDRICNGGRSREDREDDITRGYNRRLRGRLRAEALASVSASYP